MQILTQCLAFILVFLFFFPSYLETCVQFETDHPDILFMSIYLSIYFQILHREIPGLKEWLPTMLLEEEITLKMHFMNMKSTLYTTQYWKMICIFYIRKENLGGPWIEKVLSVC